MCDFDIAPFRIREHNSIYTVERIVIGISWYIQDLENFSSLEDARKYILTKVDNELWNYYCLSGYKGSIEDFLKACCQCYKGGDENSTTKWLKLKREKYKEYRRQRYLKMIDLLSERKKRKNA